MLHVNRLVTNTAFDTKIGEVEDKISDVSGLLTNTAFNTKSGRVEKNTDHNKYIATNEFNNCSGAIFDEKKSKSVTNTDLANVKQRAHENKKRKIRVYDFFY